MYAANSSNQIVPAARPTAFDSRGRRKLHPKTAIDNDTNTIIGKSRVNRYGLMSLNGEIVPASPTTASVLKRFDPTMFPSTNSCSPFRADATALASSGSDVPSATTVRPISS